MLIILMMKINKVVMRLPLILKMATIVVTEIKMKTSFGMSKCQSSQ